MEAPRNHWVVELQKRCSRWTSRILGFAAENCRPQDVHFPSQNWLWRCSGDALECHQWPPQRLFATHICLEEGSVRLQLSVCMAEVIGWHVRSPTSTFTPFTPPPDLGKATQNRRLLSPKTNSNSNGPRLGSLCPPCAPQCLHRGVRAWVRLVRCSDRSDEAKVSDRSATGPKKLLRLGPICLFPTSVQMLGGFCDADF